jgi:predicted DNA-binding protein (MmcQ/YjbR family)
MKYNIYAGLGGTLGGAQYRGTGEFENFDDAEDYAYRTAVEDYESYEGYHGILSWYDVAQENELDPDNPDNEEEINELYHMEKEDWIDYYAILFEEDDLDEEIVEI